MKWFTIYVDGLHAECSEEIPQNSAGQFIPFNGKGSLRVIMEKAYGYGQSWASVQVFSGKRIGRLIATFSNGRLAQFNNGKPL